LDKGNPKTAPANGFLAAVVFNLVLILLFPITLIGYLLWSISFLTGNKSGASGTAVAPLIARWYQHLLGTRRDEAAIRQIKVVPSIPLANTLGMGPTIIAHRVSGYVPEQFRYPFTGKITLGNQGTARQTLYDDVLKQNIAAIAQFVILGAGFDTRALNLPKDTPIRSFEIDTPPTIAFKREVLAKAGVDASHVTFVPADFENQDWFAVLKDAGFDPAKPSLFIWEGVTPYLDRTAVEATLRHIASTAKGSLVAFDYFSSEVLESQALMMRSIRASLNAGGEPLKFGLDSTPPLRERTAELLSACGLTLVEQRTMGTETDGQRAWGGFAIAAVK